MPFFKLNSIRRAVSGFAAARGGATVVEFGIISLPFLALLFSIMELGLIFMASITIESATVTAARQIRTGQLQQGSSNSAAGFKTLICNGMSWISVSDCMTNLSVDVRTYSSFAAINVAPPIAGNAIDQTQLTFDDGAACSIVLVRVFYPWTLITPVLEPGLPNLGPTQRLLTTAIVFRNENYQAEGPACS
jgi:Flp pilus assembly protein TadG